MLGLVARSLAGAREEFVFVGGTVVGLLLTDQASEEPRPTEDVDVTVQVTSYADYELRLVPELKRLGFQENMDAGRLCAWLVDGVPVDVMPTDEKILGFTNRWYAAAIPHAQSVEIGGAQAKIISAPYFLATKFLAFRNRGQADYSESHDLEDIVLIVDGRPELAAEVAGCDAELREYLRGEIEFLLGNEDFLNFLPGHFSRDVGRDAVVLARLRALADLCAG